MYAPKYNSPLLSVRPRWTGLLSILEQDGSSRSIMTAVPQEITHNNRSGAC